MKCLAHATVLLAVSIGVAACGQKGPLVLPDAPPKHKRLPPLSSPVKPQDAPAAPAPTNPAQTAPAAPTPPPDLEPSTPAFNGAAAATLTTPR